jgi:uncharacterized membrane protein YdcZ (DUF606 family)
LLCFDKISKRFRPILLMIVSFGGIALRLVLLGLSFYSAFTTGVAGLAGNYIAGLLSDNMGVLAMMKLTTIPSIMGFLFFAVTSIVFMHRREA